MLALTARRPLGGLARLSLLVPSGHGEPRLLVCGGEADRQVLDAVDEIRAQALGGAVNLDIGEAAEELLEHDLEFLAREAGAQAKVLADAEPQVLVGRARDVEA